MADQEGSPAPGDSPAEAELRAAIEEWRRTRRKTDRLGTAIWAVTKPIARAMCRNGTMVEDVQQRVASGVLSRESRFLDAGDIRDPVHYIKEMARSASVDELRIDPPPPPREKEIEAPEEESPVRAAARLRARTAAAAQLEGGVCPVHETHGVCIHGVLVFEALRRLLVAAETGGRWTLVHARREIKASLNARQDKRLDKAVERHVHRCLEWWWYAVTAETDEFDIDDYRDDINEVAQQWPRVWPSGSKRQQEGIARRVTVARFMVVTRLRLDGQGRWDKWAYPQTGAVRIYRDHPDLRGLLDLHKAPVAEFLRPLAAGEKGNKT